MKLLLCLTFIAGVAAAQSPDSSQVKLLRYELKDFVRQEFSQQEKSITELKSEMAKIRYVYSAVLFVITAAGIVSFFQLRRFAVEKARKMFVKEMERTDPTKLTLKIPKKNFAPERKRLEWTGFEKLKEYETLDKSCTEGIVIFPAQDDKEARRLLKFMDDYEVDSKKATFIIYTPKQLDDRPVQDFPNVTFANRPLSLVQAVFVAARGLKK